ncbi:MAG: hypothetical protein E3J72_01910 [Planctomycetota bacterium]|nr:MAG: hypothetical protein E3J72_01910 [Planctomycetota bacterium]
MPVTTLRKTFLIITGVCLFGFLSSGGCKKEEKVYVPVSIQGGSASTQPGRASNPLPPNLSPDVPLTILLDWSDTANTDRYGVLLTTVDGPPITADGMTDSQWLATGLSGNVTYYWQVFSGNSEGSKAGPVWSFFTNPNMPDQVGFGLPCDGTENIPVTVLLDWNAANKASKYNLYFGSEPNPPLVAIDLTVTQWQATSLANLTAYYWRVDSVNSYGVIKGPAWRFTTE